MNAIKYQSLNKTHQFADKKLTNKKKSRISRQTIGIKSDDGNWQPSARSGRPMALRP